MLHANVPKPLEKIPVPRPVPEEGKYLWWEVVTSDGRIFTMMVTAVEVTAREPSRWQAYCTNGSSMQTFEIDPDSHDLRKKNDQPHPLGWVYSVEKGWHELDDEKPVPDEQAAARKEQAAEGKPAADEKAPAARRGSLPPPPKKE